MPIPGPVLAETWPLFGLQLTTPRLLLTVASDGDLAEVVALVKSGIHAPDRMPFGVPWTLAADEELGPQTLQHLWGLRAQLSPEHWDLSFVVRRGGIVVGIQDVRADRFAVRRTVGTGSWLGRDHQGQGVGTEMRAAVLAFAFDHLGARRAESGAFVDNPASRAVSMRLGYSENGIHLQERRPGEAVEHVDFVLTPDRFRRPTWALGVSGLEPCRHLLGLTDTRKTK